MKNSTTGKPPGGLALCTPLPWIFPLHTRLFIYYREAVLYLSKPTRFMFAYEDAVRICGSIRSTQYTSV